VTTKPERIDWEACVAAHGHTVTLGLLAAGARLDEAQELTHEAFSRLFEQAATGRLTRLDFPGLAVRQAHFLLAERRRSSSMTRQRAVGVEQASEVPAGAATPEDRLADHQALAAARELLERCSPRQRAVVEAVVEGPDVPHRALAEREGVSLQRFRQILCEVRALLRTATGRSSP
jgi:RNA polymerase sigma-70 factor (ECF subfamily)